MKTIKIKSHAGIPPNYTGIVVFPDGRKDWYLNGKLHREEGPCTECKDCHSGNFELCLKPGPAIISSNGTKHWYLNGEFHRENGPAAVWPDGTKQWCLNGECHREDGPAIVWPSGRKQWFLNGKEVGKKTVELFYMLKHKKVLDL
jgi:hypothetical protein